MQPSTLQKQARAKCHPDTKRTQQVQIQLLGYCTARGEEPAQEIQGVDIHIVAIDSEPPSWRVYLNQYFIVCSSEAEAHDTAQRAAASLPGCRRPARPPTPQARVDEPEQPGALSSSADYESEN